MARLIQANGETELAARFASAAHEQVDRVAEQLAGLERQARATAQRAAGRAKVAREELQGRAEVAREELQRQTQYAVERAQTVLRERPLLGAALALAAGLIVLAVLRGGRER